MVRQEHHSLRIFKPGNIPPTYLQYSYWILTFHLLPLSNSSIHLLPLWIYSFLYVIYCHCNTHLAFSNTTFPSNINKLQLSSFFLATLHFKYVAIYFITSTLQRISLSVLSMFMNEKYEKFQWGQVDSVETAEIVGITEMLFPSQIKNSLPL